MEYSQIQIHKKKYKPKKKQGNDDHGDSHTQKPKRMKIDIEIEKKQAALKAKKRKEDVRSPSPVELSSIPETTRSVSPVKTRKHSTVLDLSKQEPVLKKPNLALAQLEQEEEVDDLEMMMRDFQEREAIYQKKDRFLS